MNENVSIFSHVKGDDEQLGVISIQTVTQAGDLTSEGSLDTDELGRVVVRGDVKPSELARQLSETFQLISERYEELAAHYEENGEE